MEGTKSLLTHFWFFVFRHSDLIQFDFRRPFKNDPIVYLLLISVLFLVHGTSKVLDLKQSEHNIYIYIDGGN